MNPTNPSNSMKAINSKNSINSMNPTNTTTMNKESYNFMDVPKIRPQNQKFFLTKLFFELLLFIK